MSPAAVPTLTVSIPTFTESMNGDAPGRDCYTVKELAWILDAAWTALDITGLGLDGLEYAAYGGPALCSVYVVGGDDGESDADLIERWNACVESARFAVLDDHSGQIAYYAEHCLLAGRRVPQSRLDDIAESDDYVWLAAVEAGEASR